MTCPLTNNQSGVKYRPNNDSGYYQSINADGSWGVMKTQSCYTSAAIGAKKTYARLYRDEGIQKPFRYLPRLTVVFSVLTVVLTVAVGMVLASFVQWKR